MAKNIKLTITISTYNRPQVLARCLDSLVACVLKGVEVVVIDNGTDPATKKVVASAAKKLTTLKYFHSNKTGLAHARNLGWKKAGGEYVAYIDDDAVATRTWVKEILQFIKDNPRVAAFGGPYTSVNQSQIPSWIPPEVTKKVIPGRAPRPIKLGSEWLNGTNIIFKRSVLEELHGFNEKLGVNANKRAYGEETDLQIRLYNAGYKIWYVPTIKVMHEFALFKMNMGYLLKNQFTHGYNSHEVFLHLKKSSPGKTAGNALAKLTEPNIPMTRRLYYALAPGFYLAGMLAARFRL